MRNAIATIEDTTLEAAVRTQNFFTDLAAAVKERAAEDRGQTAVEYVGILVVIALIFAAITALGIPGKVKTAAGDALKDIGIK